MKSQGEMAEAEFLRRAIRENLIVSKPFGERQRYDFIIDSGNNTKRIQVKSTNNYSEEKKCFEFVCGHGGSSKEPYTKTDIDFFAFYLIPKDIWYIVPVYSIQSTRVRFYDNNKTCRLGMFLGNWKILKQ